MYKVLQVYKVHQALLVVQVQEVRRVLLVQEVLLGIKDSLDKSAHKEIKGCLVLP